ncbi:G-protein coupled receptor 35 [Limanda limanda]|uniref:G-protein coupled receptor 35 n=1 Tax=Limanda limanda TaxID=27771 RepID=UPI0029C7058D|nr:G-protein coupled receptor 35 [Limanda limanda]
MLRSMAHLENMNITNDTCHVEHLQGLAYTPLFLLGFLINAAALRAFITMRDSWTETHIYMFNLAIADSALVLFLPFRIYDAYFCLQRTPLCTVLISIHFTTMYASIMTTTAISVHRYLAVRFPLQTRLWRRKKEIAVAVCLFIWGLLVTASVIYRKENYPDKLWTCYERCKNGPLHIQFILIMVGLGYLTPLVIVLFCSSHIISVLSKSDDKSEEKKSIVGLVSANMIVFIVCYTPIHIGFLINYFSTPPENWQSVFSPPHLYLLVCEWIATTNCCFDSISYYFLLKNFYS